MVLTRVSSRTCQVLRSTRDEEFNNACMERGDFKRQTGTHTRLLHG